MVLGSLILAISFSSTDDKDATDQIYLHLGDGGGNTHQKTCSITFDLIFPSTLTLLKGS